MYQACVSSLHFPPESFRRLDESDDADFYAEQRLVTHIDDATIAALTQLYRERLPAGGAILDLMSSWVSHLPPEIGFARVAGLGMNRYELQQNPRLTDFVIHNLNATPELPYPEWKLRCGRQRGVDPIAHAAGRGVRVRAPRPQTRRTGPGRHVTSLLSD